MELRVLKNFLAVAHEGNMTAAAAKLHIAQPTLSRQIAALERELDVMLFRRASHHVTLTQEGRLLQRRAEELVALAEKTEREFGAMNGPVEGDVYFGAAETDAMAFIARVSEKMRRGHPSIRMRLFSGNAADLTSQLDRGTLDFAVLSQPANMAKYESVGLPTADEWVLITRRDNPLAAKEGIRPTDLEGEPMLVSRQAMGYGGVDNNMAAWLGDAAERLSVVGDFNLPYNASVFVREGMGSLITFDKIIDTSPTSPLCAVPLEPRLYAKLAVVWRKGAVLSQAAACFLDYLQRALADAEA